MNLLILKYIARLFFWNCLLVAFGLMSLFSFLDLLETLDDVGKGDFTLIHSIQVVLLGSGSRLVELLPVTVTLCSLLTIGGLANNKELVIFRAVGVSKNLLTALLAALGLLLSVVSIVMLELLIPKLEKAAHELSTLKIEKTTVQSDELWTRQGVQTLRIGNLESRHVPREIEIYETDSTGSLVRFVEANKAYFQDDGTWLLFDIKETTFRDDQVKESIIETRVWDSFLTREQFGRLVSPPATLSITGLLKHLNQNKILAVDSSEYSSLLWKKISLPLTLMAMSILSVPLAGASIKNRSNGFLAVLGGAIGILLYLIEQTASNLDQLLDLSPALTSLTPALIIIAITILLNRHST